VNTAQDLVNSRRQPGEQSVPRFRLIPATFRLRDLRLTLGDGDNGNVRLVESVSGRLGPEEQFHAHVGCVDVVGGNFCDVAGSFTRLYQVQIMPTF